MNNSPENYDKLWTITLSNKDYSKVIQYVNVTNFEYHFTELGMTCIYLNEACKPEKIWSAGWYHYNKDKSVNPNMVLVGSDILSFNDIYNIDNSVSLE